MSSGRPIQIKQWQCGRLFVRPGVQTAETAAFKEGRKSWGAVFYRADGRTVMQIYDGHASRA